MSRIPPGAGRALPSSPRLDHIYYWQPARHPRAGAAVGLTLLALWLGAVGFALASDDPDRNTGTRDSSAQVDARFGR